ncbi:MAG: hypothetical protein QG567_359 [Campylobacterota bacterium]|nr:hypothetical protein [Campylobacterota bacterium]
MIDFRDKFINIQNVSMITTIILQIIKRYYLALNILKIFLNDFILFSLNMIVVGIVYINFIYQNFHINSGLEILSIALIYYAASIFNTMFIVFLLYLIVHCAFHKHKGISVFKKLEMVSYLFDKYYEEIDNIDDFELKLNNYLSL